MLFVTILMLVRKTNAWQNKVDYSNILYLHKWNNVKWIFLYVRILQPHNRPFFGNFVKFSAELFSELIWVITFELL